MITTFILSIILQVFGALESVVFPTLPSSFTTYWNSGLTYIRQGLSWIYAILDINYVSALLSWWISLGAIFLTVELVYNVWSLVTGNGHNTTPTSDRSSDAPQVYRS